ncbi:type II secretion system F family protein [Eubacterium sp. 1001713B170207_170306_E7]|uniref:type II secretion system F family protein n=1 Tax=Eubacterium sp. 1001713B170207_170306_E7 TaxID=2787097 RepID=UPI0018978EF6|nr:type II secretion system F family protein [Eubacterium sp. 1001713B170207_170306_E7]
MLGLFCRQLAITLSAGVSIIDALELSGREHKNSGFGETVLQVKMLVKQGNSLSEALRQFPGAFPELMVQMARSGEMSGSMDLVMENLGIYYEGQSDMRSKITQALFYPSLVTIVAVGVVMYLMAGVLPAFAEIFENMEAKLPMTTELLMRASTALVSGGAWILLAVLLLLAAGRAALRREAVALLRDRFLLKLPWIGRFIGLMEGVRFADAMAIMVNSGIDMISALEIAGKILGNRVMRYRIRDVREAVRRGEALSDSLAAAGIFDRRFVQMVRIGESSGTMEQVLIKVSAYYNDEINRKIKKMTALLEPVVLLVVGGLVFFIMASVMQPVFEIYSGYSELV